MTIQNKKVEILAPAGSYDIMKAVIHAGADAVYLGGSMFGARAYAGNFNPEELIQAIDYAHLRNRKIYLTVNTLLKEREINQRLVEYIRPYYEAGLDAVIVQDQGGFYEIHQAFPDLHIHASTQMAITGSEGARLLQQMGATRIVTARELSLEEISEINKRCDIEIESFVHGALCYCYSGQCLYSSMNGGRSGNRGRCAQPCRMSYGVLDENNEKQIKNGNGYVLSPKDMCALPILPEVIEAGVYSLKIEGRMKKLPYAAGVTQIYRKYVDLYLEKGKSGYHVDEKDIHDLMDLYNRGAFTEGYYTNRKGSSMISMVRPNHMGTKALKVLDNKNGLVTFEALEKIYPQDVFEISAENSFSSGSSYEVKEKFQVNLPRKYLLNPGRVLYRTKCTMLTEGIQEQFGEEIKKTTIHAKVTATIGQPITLTLSEKRASITLQGDLVQQAMKQPMTKESISQKLSKMGDTPFVISEIDVELNGDVFIPVGQLNELRRNAAKALESEILAGYKRTSSRIQSTKDDDIALNNVNISSENRSLEKNLLHSVLVQNVNQLKTVCELPFVDTIYLEFTMFDQNAVTIAEATKLCLEGGKSAVLALPHILRQHNERKLIELMEKAEKANVDGYLVRNIEEIGLAGRMAEKNPTKAIKNLITDHTLYTWNSKASLEYNLLALKAGLSLIRTTMPLELTADEMQDMQENTNNQVQTELIVYTRIPLMFSEQCVKKTMGSCDGKNGVVYLKDKKEHSERVQSVCSYCYSIVYDAEKMDIRELDEKIQSVGPDYIRFEFVDGESPKEIFEETKAQSKGTMGHFLLGVE